MLNLGSLIFANPWILTAFVALPAIWWLLRVFPPSPERIRSPTIRLILGLAEKEPEASSTPWWLILLRLFVVSLIIVGLARPILNPNQNLTNKGPLMLVVDNGWAGAQHWDRKLAIASNLIDQAARESRSVTIIDTAARRTGAPEPAAPTEMTPKDARAKLDAMKPKPWMVDRMAALKRLKGIKTSERFHIAWISDGLDNGHAAAFAEGLQQYGTVELFRDTPEDLPTVLTEIASATDGFDIKLARVPSSVPLYRWVQVLDAKGRLLGRVNVTTGKMTGGADVHLKLPVELRNRAVRVEIAGTGTAAGVALLDDRAYRRKVGLVAGDESSSAQPLLTDTHYIESAVKPFADLQTGTLKQVLDSDADIIIMTDADVVPPDQVKKVEDWMERGGMLIQFAGPHLANQGNDLLPVTLRDGARALGGAMTWSSPAKLAPFDRSSPFYGIDIPDDVAIREQVLAEPNAELADRTWAKLVDGTPLITAKPVGPGWTILVHTTANPDWSNLPLSGLFLDLMQRMIGMANGVTRAAPKQASEAPRNVAPGSDKQMLRPVNGLNGFGQLGSPLAGAQPIAASALRTTEAGPDHPPGYYEAPGLHRALNLASQAGPIDPSYAMQQISNLPGGVILSRYDAGHETDLRAPLLTAAALLAAFDLLIALFLGGRLTSLARVVIVAGLGGTLVFGGQAHAAQQGSKDFTAERAALSLHLAYVRTGDPSIDHVSRAGLQGLSNVLSIRTSVHPDAPIGVSLSQDELAFFPLLYWPVTADERLPSKSALANVRTYLKNGGTILFDTRDGDGSPGQSAESIAPPATTALRKILAALGHSRLQPPGQDHVITHSFYLIRWFPGRYADGQIWLDPTPSNVRDGVSSVIAGGNDWAAAWATNAQGTPTGAIADGSERQREMAYRFGVNLVMYVLTGNYKSDQVHIPILLERLGRRRFQ
ncbi:MAG TPA: DUF4159 domain-containing protein [Alphaproteobacteria bacterium]|nr:DUF4159 domain-containing protein [Alphaproteobacteria bacterium]